MTCRHCSLQHVDTFSLLLNREANVVMFDLAFAHIAAAGLQLREIGLVENASADASIGDFLQFALSV
jgi:hypothetical protein